MKNSTKLRKINKQANQIKKQMGLNGRLKAGDLITKSNSLKKKVAIMGLI